MEHKIEKINKMRKIILHGVLIGTSISFGLFMYPTINSTFRISRRFSWTRIHVFFRNATDLWFLTLIVFMVGYWIYRGLLIRNESLRAAVNDERVKSSWLKAYRIAFIVVVCVTIFWKWYETGLFPDQWRLLPDPPWLIVYGAVISLVAAFLIYNREAKKE